MKKAIISMVVLLLVILAGCSSGEREAEQLGESFIQKLYTVNHVEQDDMDEEKAITLHEEFSPYLTEEAQDQLAMERTILSPYEIAELVNGTVAVKDISFKEDPVDESNDAYYVDHSFRVIVKDGDNETIEEKNVKGQITFKKVDDEWKIKRYQDNAKLGDLINPVKE